MIPNLHAVMAEMPELLRGYRTLHELFVDSGLNEDEQTIVWQTISVENTCHYCVPAHTGIAKSRKVDDAITDALRDGTLLPNAHPGALRTFTLQVVRQRGDLSETELQTFFDAGYI
ncbi:carboxymuconolactone decarboxylase family protein [Roseovarius sp. S4756]|uniref:carboxymuconolactone decarboxylase family protein n=1 Tax=Roseovarius maritimus TaxID=3342637 RepID=UPI00372BA0EC